MKKIQLIIMLLLCFMTLSAQEAKNFIFDSDKPKKEEYKFSTTWRLSAGYVQDWQRSQDATYPDLYLHGGKIGATIDFNLPYHISVQTGLAYAMTGNKQYQHWRSLSSENTQKEYIEHHILKHTLSVPIHLYYTQTLWRKMRLAFFTGPTMQIGIAETNNLQKNLSSEAQSWLISKNLRVDDYEKYSAKELYRFNIQWSIGGAYEWDKYRIFGAYSFGLNNLVNNYPNNYVSYLSTMNEWSWTAGFSYAF